MKVKFIEIGRNKVNFEKECPKEITENWVIKQIQPYVLSKNIDVMDNCTIWAGMTYLGKFEVV